MKRMVGALSEKQFDLLVIGGGIYGAWTAYDASLRGMRVALIDKGDWASGTSSASSKLIHGGLRYLEHYHFNLVKKALNERVRLIKNAPHRVKPLRFLVPLYEWSRVKPRMLKMGLWAYDRFAGGKTRVEPHEMLKHDDVYARCPGLNHDDLLEVFAYSDAQTDDARLVVEIIDGACDSGAVVANYAEAVNLTREDNRITGAMVKDREKGTTFNIKASMIVSTMGQWAPELCKSDHGSGADIRMTKGIHIILPKFINEDAFLLMAKEDGRVFFVIPWYGKTMVGTTDTDYTGDINNVCPESDEIDYLLEETNRVFPNVNFNHTSLCGSFAGLRVMQDQEGLTPGQVTRDWTLKQVEEGLLMSIGGKITSAREDAEHIVTHVAELLKKKSMSTGTTGDRPFPWCPGYDFNEFKENFMQKCVKIGLDEETSKFCIDRYGAGILSLIKTIKKTPSLAERIVPDLPFCKAEIVHCINHEMALHLEDILRRRIPVLLLQKLDLNYLKMIVKIIAPVLKWNGKQRKHEIESVAEKWLKK